MSDLLQWAITTIVAILGILVGRTWQKYDRSNEKDRATFTIIKDALQDKTIYFLRNQNFGSSFRPEELEGLMLFLDLPKRYPALFFLDRSLEKTKHELFDCIKEFLDACYELVDHRFGLQDHLIRVKKPGDYENSEEGWSKFNSDRTELSEKAEKILQAHEKLNVLVHRKL